MAVQCLISKQRLYSAIALIVFAYTGSSGYFGAYISGNIKVHCISKPLHIFSLTVKLV